MSRRSVLSAVVTLAIVFGIVALVGRHSGRTTVSVQAGAADQAASAAAAPHVHNHAAAPVPPKVLRVLPNGTIDPTKIDLSGVPGVTAAELARATSLLRRTITTITKWTDYRKAEADGFHSIGDFITGDEHFLHWDWINDNDYFDPNKPEALVYHYDRDTGKRTLEAAMYILPDRFSLTNLPDLGGPLTQFHVHDNLCFTNDPVAPHVLGLTNGDGTCSPPLVKFHPNPMVHVWIRNNPCGPFAALEGVGAGQIPDGQTRSCLEHDANLATL